MAKADQNGHFLVFMVCPYCQVLFGTMPDVSIDPSVGDQYKAFLVHLE